MWKADDFIGKKVEIIKHFKRVNVTTETVSEYCTLAGIPIIVVCEFIMEEIPEHTEFCKQKIKDLKKFYGIKI